MHTAFLNNPQRNAIFLLLFFALPVFLFGQVAPPASPDTSAPLGPATPITLQEAIQIALEKNPLRKVALADQKVAATQFTQARSLLLPHVEFSESATRGNDPVYVFGTKLRQQRFTTADFALNQLNTPTPVSNFSSRFAGEWNLFDSFASWKNMSRARLMQQASASQLERTDQELAFRTVQSYYGLLLARKQLEVAQQSNTTSQSLLDQANNRFEAGLVVESDLLSAKVNAASRHEELIRAENAVSMAQAELGVAIGLSAETSFQPAEPLAEKSPQAEPLPQLESTALTTRPDLKRIRAEESAQEKSVSIAKSSFGPKLNAFASWQTDSQNMFSNGGNNWVGGLELKLDLFSGGAKLANLAQQKALQQRASAGREGFENQVRLEVRQAYYQLQSACQQVDVARSSSDQAHESLRISQNRYDSGLATMTDLLQIQQAMTTAQTNYWNSVYQCRTSFANLKLAEGTLNSQSVMTP